jgi:hypothetical protein
MLKKRWKWDGNNWKKGGYVPPQSKGLYHNGNRVAPFFHGWLCQSVGSKISPAFPSDFPNKENHLETRAEKSVSKDFSISRVS